MADEKGHRRRSSSIVSVSSDSIHSSFLTASSTPASSKPSSSMVSSPIPSSDDDILIIEQPSANRYADGPHMRKHYVIEDISDGRSAIPIRVVNDIDDMDYGSDVFVFSVENLYSHTADASEIDVTQGPVPNGKIDPCQERIDFYDNVLYECCEECGCKAKCGNTFSTKLMPYRYELFRRRNVGFGCRTLDAIQKGSFVCEFVGEVITKEQAATRTVQSFMYTSYHHPADSDLDTVVDPYFYGTCARFFNHSCDENLLPFRFYREFRQVEWPRMGFFAKCDIKRNTELTIDYGTEWWEMNIRNGMIEYCCCDADFCLNPGPNRRQITEAEIEAECEQLEQEVKEIRKRLAELNRQVKHKNAVKRARMVDGSKKERSTNAPRARSTRNSNRQW
ncbi:hypothetical protein QR680_015367 [Steinernema hermaphroditum]|uniref:SET domain-containing protein n=1 Tax=Steinernema hermaphroditum TaxID=289476 RepID=A0AA39H8D5_9BILA|nr:hypothetical protein QR680_015367 [Steinernema hermaphroditum]